MDIQIQAPEMDKFATQIAAAPGVLRTELTLAMTRSGLHVVKYARPNAPVDRGALRNSITSQPMWPTTNIGSNLPYAPAQEDGRRAGARMPPTSAIAGWLGRVGGDPTAAFVVARAIGRNGIVGKKFLKTGLQSARSEIQREFHVAIRNVIAKVV